MALENIQFTDRLGRPLPPTLREQLVTAVLRAIAHPKANIDAVVERAQAIARIVGDGEKNIDDLLRYATKALFAVSRKEDLKLKQEPVMPESPSKDGNSGRYGDCWK